MSVTAQGDFFNFGADQPTVDNQDKPWIKTDASGNLIGIFTFASGAWTRPHPIPAGPNGFVAMWAGDLADLDTFDGGTAGAVSATSGPFWTYLSDFDDKIPRGATATVPVNTNASQLASGSSATDQVRGIYFIQRTARVYYVG